jgi:hypothetical protein
LPRQDALFQLRRQGKAAAVASCGADALIGLAVSTREPQPNAFGAVDAANDTRGQPAVQFDRAALFECPVDHPPHHLAEAGIKGCSDRFDRIATDRGFLETCVAIGVRRGILADGALGGDTNLAAMARASDTPYRYFPKIEKRNGSII